LTWLRPVRRAARRGAGIRTRSLDARSLRAPVLVAGGARHEERHRNPAPFACRRSALRRRRCGRRPQALREPDADRCGAFDAKEAQALPELAAVDAKGGQAPRESGAMRRMPENRTRRLRARDLCGARGGRRDAAASG